MPREVTRTCRPESWARPAGGNWPIAAAHRHMLWRRVFYKFVDLHDQDRRTNFHFNAYELVDHLRQITPQVRTRRLPLFYPLVSNMLIVADKSG